MSRDGTIIHVFKDAHPTEIGSDVTIGHGAILHGCTIADRAMVGIGAIVLDGAVVESDAIVAAGAVVSPGNRVKAGEMWAGCPGQADARGPARRSSPSCASTCRNIARSVPTISPCAARSAPAARAGE